MKICNFWKIMSFNYQDYSEEAINSMIDKGGRAKETISRENSVLNSPIL